jgi:hypothetical protein
MNELNYNSPLVVKSLFDKATHEGIIEYLDTRVPFLSVVLDETSFVRTYIHNDPFFMSIHQQLADFASEIFSEPLKPSYVFLSMYLDGGTCPLHIDRPQCYRTIDYLIRQDQHEPWPILIGDQMNDDQIVEIHESGKSHPETEEEIKECIDAENWHEVLLEPNDAALYSGTHSWHYRPEKLNGSADLAFFHFVKEDFDGPLH